jgi:hypothetical protein
MAAGTHDHPPPSYGGLMGSFIIWYAALRYRVLSREFPAQDIGFCAIAKLETLDSRIPVSYTNSVTHRQSVFF